MAATLLVVYGALGLLGVSVSSAAEELQRGIQASALSVAGSSALPSPPLTPSPFSHPHTLSPAQRTADQRSRSAYTKLTRDAAINLAKSTFHIDRPSWTPPGQETGGHISQYINERSAVEALPNGKQLVLASTLPLRAHGAHGLQPISLSFEDQGGEYSPSNPLVPVVLSKHAKRGVTFGSGLTISPETGEGEGPTIVGNSLVFANAATDTDLIEEPVPLGVELSWQLRSPASPAEEGLNFHLPPGTSLEPTTNLPGGVAVAAEGKPLLVLPPAVALAADGTAVPTSYTVAGDVLKIHVDLGEAVQFPVLVDPLVIAYYGAFNNANVWPGWNQYESTAGWSFQEYYNLLQVGANPGPPAQSYGEWYFDAPPGGTAGITRVDVSGVTHSVNPQSAIQGEIYGSNGPEPIYTFNGLSRENDRPTPLNTLENLSNASLAFCAQQGGGSDSENPSHLCNMESYMGTAFYLNDKLSNERTTVFNYTQFTGVVARYLDNTLPDEVTVENVENQWYQYGPPHVFIKAHDSGVGIQRFDLRIPPEWPFTKEPYFKEELSCNNPNGFTGCNQSEDSQEINLTPIATGAYTLGAYAYDAAGNIRQQEPAPKLYIDHTAPVISLSGPLHEASGQTIGNGNFKLNFTAEDGNVTSPQSGPYSVSVAVDGRAAYEGRTTCPRPTGPPTQGCYALGGSWTMNGQAWGAGSHVIKVSATDWTGNTSSSSFTVTVNEAPYEAVGPGAVNLVTGDMKLQATDVSVSGGTAGLALSRTYDSRLPAQGELGPLGPAWQLNLPDTGADGMWQRLTPLSEGGVALFDAHGDQLIFSPKQGGGYTSPPGYQTDTLSEPSSGVYQLTDAAGNYTKFSSPGNGAAYLPTTVAQATASGGVNRVTYKFTKTTEGITEPTEMLGPEPAGANLGCETTLVKGCRALTFEYATSTSAGSGESPSEWGNYRGYLQRVFFNAWDPTKSEMARTAVAEYAYDAKGRLRAVWDPRISPALKSYYGYDSEGHITAVTAPGQQPWLMHYAALGGDANTGRLLAAVRPSAATKLAVGEPPKNTAVPTLSSTQPEIGIKLTVKLTSEKTPGTWSNSPLSFSYRWERCNATGGECAPIEGAVNQSYYPQEADKGHTLALLVTATNATGSMVASSAATSVVEKGTPNTPLPEAPEVGSTSITTIEYALATSGTGLPNLTKEEVEKWAQKDQPVEGTAIFPPDAPQGWPAASYTRATIYYLDSSDHPVNTTAPTGGISTSEYNKATNNIERTLSADNRAEALKEPATSKTVAEHLSTEYVYSQDGTELTSTLGPEHKIKLANGEETQARKHSQYFYDEGAPSEGGPYRLVTKTTEGAETATKGEQDVRTVSTRYGGQEGLGWKLHLPTSTTTGSKESTTAYDPNTGQVAETRTPAGNNPGGFLPVYSSKFGSLGSGKGQFKYPKQITTDGKGNIVIADADNNRIVIESESGEFLDALGWGVKDGKSEYEICTKEASACQAGIAGSGNGQFNEPKGVAIDSEGNLYVADTHNNRIEKFSSAYAYLTAAGTGGSGKLQFNSPRGISIVGSELLVADDTNNRIQRLGTNLAFVSMFGWGVLDGKSEFERCSSEASSCKAGLAGSGEGELSEPKAVIEGEIPGTCEIAYFVADGANNRISTYCEHISGKGLEVHGSLGSAGSGKGQLKSPKDLRLDAHGGLWVVDEANNRVVEMTAERGEFEQAFGWGVRDGKSEFEDCTSEAASCQAGIAGSGNGEFNLPWGIAFDARGNLLVGEENNHRIQRFANENAAAHTTQTMYYTAGTESSVPACRSHPEWAGLPCQGQPQSDPETFGLPKRPVTSYSSYNLWDEPLKTVDTVGATTRTATVTYDSAGRTTSGELTSNGPETSLAAVTDEYSTTTGTLEKLKRTTEGKTETLTSVFNTLGAPTSYTDAAGNVSTYEYEPEGDARLLKTNDGKGTQTFTYDKTTGLETGLADSAAGTFTATYDAEGNITSEAMPNGMTSSLTRNSAGEPTGTEYVKTTHCTSNCTWYSDAVIPSIHSQWMSQTTTLAKYSYSYSSRGWLTEVQETPTGKGCTARLYGFNEDGSRISQTTREPGSEGRCATSGGTVETWSQDAAGRLYGAGVAQDPFGNVTNLPANDAGGNALTASFYVSNTLASIEQNGEKIVYKLDPSGRTRETVSSGKEASTVISHYADGTDSPAWTASGTTWTRYISDIRGGLGAIQSSSGSTILQLANLHGDIAATAALSETETKLLSSNEATEYGVPTTAAPAKYSWLGAAQRPTELASGFVAMGARSYIPQLGRFLQPDPHPGGAATAYGYTNADPVNESDASGGATTVSYDYEAYSGGEGTNLGPGGAIAPGAIMPPPADPQLEEEFRAHPPWDATVVLETAVGAGGSSLAEAASILGKHSVPRGYFRIEKEVNNVEAGRLAGLFALLATGRNPSAGTALTHILHAPVGAIAQALHSHVIEFDQVAVDLAEAAVTATGPIKIIWAGYVIGYSKIDVIFKQ